MRFTPEEAEALARCLNSSVDEVLAATAEQLILALALQVHMLVETLGEPSRRRP